MWTTRETAAAHHPASHQHECAVSGIAGACDAIPAEHANGVRLQIFEEGLFRGTDPEAPGHAIDECRHFFSL
jgi:hypothetical protein